MRAPFLVCYFFIALFDTVAGQDILFMTKGSNLYLGESGYITIQGGVITMVDSQIENNGEIILRNKVGNRSDWTDQTLAGVFQSPKGKVFLEGNHILTGGRFINLEIATSEVVELASDLTVQNELTLTDGVIITGNWFATLLNQEADALLAGAGNADFAQSFIFGNFRRAISPNTDTYNFPVGKTDVSFNALSLTNNNITGTNSISVSFHDKLGSDAGLSVTEFGVSYNMVANYGTWSMQADQPLASGDFTLALSINNFFGLVDNSFAILTRPIGSVDASQWSVPTGGVLPADNSPGRTVVSGVAIRSALTTFGEFGIGMTSTPLPLTLLDFRGAANGSQNELVWIVTKEYDVKEYVVQKSWINASHFVDVGKVAAQNHNLEQTTTYKLADGNVMPGINFYRLKMVDLDGRITYSKVVAIDSKAALASLIVFPNPANDWLEVINPYQDGELSAIFISDSRGATLYHQAEPASRERLIRVDIGDLPAGLLVIRICDRRGCQSQRVIKL